MRVTVRLFARLRDIAGEVGDTAASTITVRVDVDVLFHVSVET